MSIINPENYYFGFKFYSTFTHRGSEQREDYCSENVERTGKLSHVVFSEGNLPILPHGSASDTHLIGSKFLNFLVILPCLSFSLPKVPG